MALNDDIFSSDLGEYVEDIEADQPHTPNKRGANHRGKDDIAEYLNPEQIFVKYIHGMRVYPYERAAGKKALRDKALVAALYTTGLRIAELLSVTKGQIEETEDFLIFKQVPIGKRRGKYNLDKALPKKGRLFPFTAIVIQYVKTVRGKDTPIFDIAHAHAYRIVNQATGVWAHYFRHQHISYLLNELRLSTVNVAKLTGHKDIRTLEGYSHATWKDFTEQLLK